MKDWLSSHQVLCLHTWCYTSNITDYWYISLNEKKVSSEHGEENGYQLRGESNFVFALVYIAAPCDWLGSLATVSKPIRSMNHNQLQRARTRLFSRAWSRVQH